MKNKMLGKLKDSITSVIPIMAIIIVVGIVLELPFLTILAFIISAVLLIIGMSMFTFGADISMLDVGEKIGTKLVKSKNIFLILFCVLFIGIAITIAEPALQVLASLVPSVPHMILVLTISIGVGIFLLIAVLRILMQFDLTKILVFFYVLLLILLIFSKRDFIPVAFDAGGVTTGPITVPFIMALGLGLTVFRSDSKAKEDSFGLIALCSIGPIITTLILGFFFNTDANYNNELVLNFSSGFDIFKTYISVLGNSFINVLLSLAPIIVIFGIFQLITKQIKKIKPVIWGLVFTLIGLTLFLTSVDVGFLSIAYEIGMKFTSEYGYLLIPLGMIIGYIAILAEPAVQILNEQVEIVTGGSISKRVMNLSLSVGVAIAIGLSLTRVFTGISILWILIPGYLIALMLTFVAPKIFTAIAFDSGGAVSGPMTTSFLLPLAIGACVALGGNILTDAFGLIAFVAMTPLITVQLIGIIYKYKTRRVISKLELDETIVDYNWRGKRG